MWLFNLLFSSLSQLWYVEVRISRSVSVSPLEFEIKGSTVLTIEMAVETPRTVYPLSNSDKYYFGMKISQQIFESFWQDDYMYTELYLKWKYGIYPKYWETFATYHSCSKIRTSILLSRY